MAWWGRKVRSVDLLRPSAPYVVESGHVASGAVGFAGVLADNVVVSGKVASGALFRNVIPDDEVYTDKLLEYHDDLSCSSGGAATVVFYAGHDLGSARIYGATLLSHASAGGVNVGIGPVNASQMGIILTQFHSGQQVVSGMPVHAWVMV